MNTKSLSFKQVRKTQKQSKYYCSIEYYQNKANKAINIL